MTRPFSRRELLATTGVAAAAVAGCSGRLPGTGPKTVDGATLHQLAKREGPDSAESIPVEIESAFITAQVDQARHLLADVPGPFTANQIPNGAVRQRLNRRYKEVTASIERPYEAPTPFVKLDHAGETRIDAREIRATWRAIDDGLTVADVKSDAPPVRDRIEAFADTWSYLGANPVRAVRVHAELELDVRGARAWTTFDRRSRHERGPFAVGEVASELERARVDVDTATYLFDQYTQSLDDAVDLHPTFVQARRELTTRLQRRAESIPDVGFDAPPRKLVDRDVGETAALWGLADLYEEFRRDRLDYRDEEERRPRLAIDVLERSATLVIGEAFRRLRQRIERGETARITTAEDVVTLRNEAVNAVEAAKTALEPANTAGRRAGLIRELLPRFADRLEYGDHQFENSSGRVSLPSVRRDAAEYVVVRETCRVLPTVAGTVATILRNGVE